MAYAVKNVLFGDLRLIESEVGFVENSALCPATPPESKVPIRAGCTLFSLIRAPLTLPIPSTFVASARIRLDDPLGIIFGDDYLS